MNSITDVIEIISRGAEATLSRGFWFGKEVIFKHRIPKNYRLQKLDEQIRTVRTLNEARALVKIKQYGVNVPQVHEIGPKNALIVMKYIKGKKLKDVIEDLPDNKLEEYLIKIGEMIALLHVNGHIHGDITTSNILITENENIFLIDFGLHEYSDTVEDKSVDLHLFKRVLISTHGGIFKQAFSYFLQGYKAKYQQSGLNDCDQIIKNISAIETRGRYVKKDERL